MSALRFGSLLALAVGCAVPTSAEPRVVVSSSVADSALAAIDLWERASEGEYSPHVVVSDLPGDCDGVTWCFVGVESLSGCGGSLEPFACTTVLDWFFADVAGVELGGITRLDLTRTPAEWRVSVLAHEIGHQLGLPDGAGLLMDRSRDGAARERPCVDAAILAAVGLGGEGACL